MDEELRPEGCCCLIYQARGRDLPCMPCRNHAEVGKLRAENEELKTKLALSGTPLPTVPTHTSTGIIPDGNESPSKAGQERMR